MGHLLKIGGVKYNKTNMPSNFKIQEVKSKKMQKTLNLFDVNKDGIISKDEAENISLFYQKGGIIFRQSKDGQTTDYVITADKAGKNPSSVSTLVIDEQSNKLLSTKTTKFDRNMNIKYSEFKYCHNGESPVNKTKETINSNNDFIETEPLKVVPVEVR